MRKITIRYLELTIDLSAKENERLRREFFASQHTLPALETTGIQLMEPRRG